MVFALETFWPASDGWSAARIEEQLVVTEGRLRGHHALPGRGPRRRRQARTTRSAATLPLEREVESNRNTALDVDAQTARPLRADER